MRPIRNVRAYGQNNKDKLFDPKEAPKTLPPTPEEKLQKLDKKLEITEKKTQRALDKKKNHSVIIERSSGDHLEIIQESLSDQSAIIERSFGDRSKRDVSYDVLICMPSRKPPRKLLEYIKKNAVERNGRWISPLDSEEAQTAIGCDPVYFKTLVYRLRNQGWFEIENGFAGSRCIVLDPKVFGLV